MWMTVKRLVVYVVAAAVLIGVFCAISPWMPMSINGRYRIILKKEFGERARLAKEFSSFNRVVGSNEYSSPPQTLKEALQGSEIVSLEFLRQGTDPWGHPFVFTSEIERDHGVGFTFRMTVRSVGPNGKDENGGGDDIQRYYYSSVVRRHDVS